MKKNIKIAAAIILVLTMCTTMFGAFATEVPGSVLEAVASAVVAEVAADTGKELPAKEEKEEEPAVEPTAEPTAEPTVEPTPEPTVEPTEEPVVEPTEEPTEEPVVEPTEEPTEEPVVEPTEEPTEEPVVEPTEEPTEEEVPGVEGTVEIKLITDGDIYIGDTVKFKAEIEGYTLDYAIQWQYNDGNGWKDLAGEDEEVLKIEVTEENADWEWRVAIIAEDVEAAA